MTATLQKIKNQKVNLVYLILILISLYYFFFAGVNGYVMQPDSDGYIKLTFTRDPVYPLFLTFFRFLLGESHYLTGVFLFQGCLAMIAIFVTLLKLKKLLSLTLPGELICFFLLLLPYGLSPMWSAPRVNYVHYIITEGITYSLFYLIIVFLLESAFTKKYRTYLYSLILLIIGTLTRGQMIYLFPLFFVTAILISIPKWKTLILRIFVLVLAFVSISVLGNLYRYTLFGSYNSSSENNITLLSNIIHASDKEDSALFENEELQALFLNMYNQAHELSYTHEFAQKGLINNGNHVLATHDIVKSSILREALDTYVNNAGYADDFAGDLYKKEVVSKLITTLLKDNFGTWLYDRISVLPYGFMITFIAITPPGLLPLCYILTAVYLIGMIILCILHYRKYGMNRRLLFTLGIFATAIINIGVISLIIFPIPRYTDFHIGLLYLSTLLLLADFIPHKKDTHVS